MTAHFATRSLISAALGLCLAACQSTPNEAPDDSAPTPTIPTPLPDDPTVALDVLFSAPFEAHYGESGQRAAAGRRILDTVDAAVRASEQPAEYAALQAACAVLVGNPNPSTFGRARREWRAVKSRLERGQ